MAKAVRTCVVCGEKFTCCHTAKAPTDGFRWQDVACSAECGEKYFAQLLASRAADVATEEPVVTEDADKAEEPEMLFD